ncbi:ankyrin repeat-containing domain protein [Mycena rosella]|uniref:Ankyrin repeat-containing domain protein n=1 Tax=Mycena rosella TaxID=1033263 RepID=A0AAD7M9M4_MYCRO|nr:ankyrin repeat-containing domain protein [Mycena rosella]
MADIVGLVASILQLVDTVAKARGYIKDFRDAPKDQERLLLEIQNLEPLVKELRTRIKSNHAAGKISGMNEFEEPLVHLNEIIERLTKKLDPAGISKFSSRLTWPLWGKEDVEEGLNATERFKSLLSAWLGVDIWKSVQDVNVTIQDVAEEQRVDHGYIIRSVKQFAQEHGVAHNETISTIKDASEEQRTDHIYIAKSIRDVARNQEKYHDSEQRDKILDWYSPLNFFLRQTDIFNAWQPGTGRWLLEADEFKDWKSGSGKMLWCRGIPGAGKTVLVSVVVENLRAEQNTSVAVLYLNHKENEAQTPSNLLAGLWRQLVFEKPISPVVDQLYAKHREQRTRPSLEHTYSILCAIIAEHSRVFIVVDALDEYPEELRDILLPRLSNLGPTVNLMFTSRPHIRIDNVVTNTIVETLEIRATEDDIRRHIAAQIRKSSRLSKHVKNCPGLGEEIETVIVRRSDGMFLLAKFHIDSLTTKHTVKAIRQALASMPNDLNTTYDEVLDRIDRQSEDDRSLARRALSWISHAKRLLHIFELREALAVEDETSNLDPDNLVDINTILSVCAGLVITTGNEEDHAVRLVHYTTHDYLNRVRARAFPHAATEITTSCITYLSFDIFSQMDDPMYLLHQNTLLDYAVEYCLIHARGQPESDIGHLILSFLANCSVWRRLWNWGHGSHAEIPISAPLWIAAVFRLEEICRQLAKKDGDGLVPMLQKASLEGFADLVKILVEKGANVDAPEGEYDSPLQAAASRGHDDIIQFLLTHGADVNLRGSQYGTALQIATFFGHKQSARLLINHGTNINAEAGRYGTALYAAAIQGNEEILHLLLENGAAVNEKGGHYGTALAAAVYRGFDGIVRVLVEHGADLNAETTLHNRPVSVLQRAIFTGPNTVVRLLIEKGAAINAAGSSGTALDIALRCGEYEVARLLIARGAILRKRNEAIYGLLIDHGVADINAEAGRDGTALYIASHRGSYELVRTLLERGVDAASGAGHEDIIRLLLEHSADVNVVGGKSTALQAASGAGHEDIARLLLEYGADVNGTGGGDTALQAASRAGHEDIVRLLLEHDADVNVTGGGDTALQAASRAGHEDIVRLLLEYDADVNVTSGGDTALQAASRAGHEDIVKLLLEHDANVNAGGGVQGSSLWAAAVYGYKEVVKLLLEQGADVSRVGGFRNRTPLQAAIVAGHKDIAQLLIQHDALEKPRYLISYSDYCGADPNVKEGNYDSTLQMASVHGDVEIIPFLLAHGADVNLRGSQYGTALQMAAFFGHKQSAQLLIHGGANINAEAGGYGTALYAAAIRCNEEMLNLLLENGTTVNEKGGRYGTALGAHGADSDALYHAALFYGHETIAHLLLDNHGADANARAGQEDRSVLQAATSLGHEKIVQLLLEHGADVNEMGWDGAALHIAAHDGCVQIARLLLEHGADIDAPAPRRMGTALYIASCNGHREVVSLLIKHGAEVNAMGGQPYNAVCGAASHGHKEIALLLIQHGGACNSALQRHLESPFFGEGGTDE